MSATPEVIKSIGWSGDSFFEQVIGWSASDSYAEVVLAYMDEHPGDLKPEITAADLFTIERASQREQVRAKAV